MLVAGALLEERWTVRTAPERISIGARFEVNETNGATRDALIVQTDATAAPDAIAWSALRLAGIATMLVPVGCVCHEGALIEILPRSGLQHADEYAAGLRVQHGPSRVVGMLASRVADLAADLAKLHGRGESHGALDARYLFVDGGGAPRLVLAGFSRCRSAERSERDDVRRLAAAFGDLVAASRAPIEAPLAAEVDALAHAVEGDPALRSAEDLGFSLRALASRLGVNVMSGDVPPVTMAVAPTPSPLVSAHDPFAQPAPKVFLPKIPDRNGTGAVAGRAIGLVIAVGLIVLRVIARTSSHHYDDYHYTPPPIPPSAFGSGSDPLGTDPTLGHVPACAEPTDPLADVVLPGHGAVGDVTAACTAGSLHAFALRGDELYRVSRGDETGAPWDPATDQSQIAHDVSTMSNAVTMLDGGAFIAAISTDATRFGIADTRRGGAMLWTRFPAGYRASGFALGLGATDESYAIAVRLTSRTASHLALLDVGAPAEGSTTLGAVHYFDAGDGTAESVQTDGGAGVVMFSTAANDGHRVLRTLRFDVTELHEAATARTARTWQPIPEDLAVSDPLTMPTPVVLTSATGEGPDHAFVVASVEPTPCVGDDTDRHHPAIADGCARYAHPSLAFFPDGASPVLSAPTGSRGSLTQLVWYDHDQYESLMAVIPDGSTRTALVRSTFDGEHRSVNTGNFQIPLTIARSIYPITTAQCAGRRWFVFVSQQDNVARVSALPVSCTSSSDMVRPLPPAPIH